MTNPVTIHGAAEAPPFDVAGGHGGVPIGGVDDSVATAGGGGTAGFSLDQR